MGKYERGKARAEKIISDTEAKYGPIPRGGGITKRFDRLEGGTQFTHFYLSNYGGEWVIKSTQDWTDAIDGRSFGKDRESAESEFSRIHENASYGGRASAIEIFEPTGNPFDELVKGIFR